MSCHLYTRSLGGAPSLNKSYIPGISRSDRRKIMVLFQLNGYFSSWDWDKKKDDKTAVLLTKIWLHSKLGVWQSLSLLLFSSEKFWPHSSRRDLGCPTVFQGTVFPLFPFQDSIRKPPAQYCWAARLRGIRLKKQVRLNSEMRENRTWGETF